jgi:uncharacterized protein (TIGR02246 family)
MNRYMVPALAGVSLFVVCAAAASVCASEPATATLDRALFALSDDLATAIARRDADAATRGVREDDHVAYVSDGAVIRGREMRDTLQRFYSGMQQIEFRWDKREVQALGKAGGVVTGWASILLVDNEDRRTAHTALFTLVYMRSRGGWELVTAHKTTVQ